MKRVQLPARPRPEPKPEPLSEFKGSYLYPPTSAPVSLAEIRKVLESAPAEGGVTLDNGIKGKERVFIAVGILRTYRLMRASLPALVELAESYLETRPGIHDSCREQCNDPDACEAKRQAARARLALAAKGVRP